MATDFVTASLMGNLAVRAYTLADQSPNGSTARKAALCCGVVLATTSSPEAARRALAGVRPDEVRDAATELFDRLTTETP